MSDNEKTIKYYFPLDVKLRADDSLEDYDNEYWRDDITSTEAVQYKDEILAQIEKENKFETDQGLMEYFHGNSPLNQKVHSMYPTVEEHGGELWGAMVMEVNGELSSDEIATLKDYIEGQNSDGYGEGLEQREIKADGGGLYGIYVSFWSSERNYAVYTQGEFNDLQNKCQIASYDNAQPTNRKTEYKPDCPIVSADGNVFNLMGLASRTLKDNGMPDKAKEMCGRVMSCGNYTEALAIMTEYVNPVSKEQDQSNDFNIKM